MNTFTTAARKKSRPAHPRPAPLHRAGLPAIRADAAVKPTDERTGGLSRAMVDGLFALPVTAFLGLILLTVGAWVAYSNPDPSALTTPLSLGALALSSLLGGLVASRRDGGKNAALCGLCSGCLFTAVLLLLSLLFGDEAQATMSPGLSSPAAWGIHAGIVGLEILGALMGRPRRRTATHHRARRR